MLESVYEWATAAPWSYSREDCGTGGLLVPSFSLLADIWGFDPFFFNLLLLRFID